METNNRDTLELNGVTVVVDTQGPKVYVGRCLEVRNDGIVLLDADEFEQVAGGRSKEQYLTRAAKFGVWKKHDRNFIPNSEIAAAYPLRNLVTQKRSSLATDVADHADANQSPRQGSTQVEEGEDTHAPVDQCVEAVVLTAAAREEIGRLLSEQQKPGMGLRLAVKGGGCSGLQYKLEFDSKKDRDLVIGGCGFDVYVDRKSAVYLRGVTLDYERGLSGKGFAFRNPNVTNRCGCGGSFSV